MGDRVTAPVPPGDREALAEFLRVAHNAAIDTDGWQDGERIGIWPMVADSLLARWLLVPVEQQYEYTLHPVDTSVERPPGVEWAPDVPVYEARRDPNRPEHQHNWQEISSAEQITDGAHVFTCGGYYGCGENHLEYDRA